MELFHFIENTKLLTTATQLLVLRLWLQMMSLTQEGTCVKYFESICTRMKCVHLNFCLLSTVLKSDTDYTNPQYGQRHKWRWSLPSQQQIKVFLLFM